MLNYISEFWNSIAWKIEAEHFSYPFWNREETEKLLLTFSQKINWALVAIDWTDFSSNVKTIDSTTFNIDDYSFLDRWIDGVIMNWLNDIQKEQFLWKTSIWIILWVWDCAPIIWSTKDWSTIFNLHWWYKWVLWNWEENNPWIIYNFISSLEKEWLSSNGIWKIHLWPMAGPDFELPLSYYEKLIRYISKEYKIIDFKEYFILNWKTNESWDKLWHLNLRWLVDILLRYHWVSMYNIEDSWINTTDKSNWWPSYRLYSNWLQKNNNRLSATISKLLY